MGSAHKEIPDTQGDDPAQDTRNDKAQRYGCPVDAGQHGKDAALFVRWNAGLIEGIQKRENMLKPLLVASYGTSSDIYKPVTRAVKISPDPISTSRVLPEQ